MADRDVADWDIKDNGNGRDAGDMQVRGHVSP